MFGDHLMLISSEQGLRTLGAASVPHQTRHWDGLREESHAIFAQCISPFLLLFHITFTLLTLFAHVVIPSRKCTEILMSFVVP